MANRPNHLVFDTFNIDLILKVAQMTFLSPLFAFWVPITVLTRSNMSSPAFHYTMIYFLTVSLLSFVRFLSKVTQNRSWEKKAPIVTSLFSGPTLNWEDEIVLVTGASGGVGEVLVELLAVLGVTVVCIDVKKGHGEMLGANKDDIYTYVCDLSKEDEIKAVAKTIREEVGSPTILINNAGIVNGKLLLDLTPDEIRKTFDVNVISQFLLIKEFLPAMLERGKGHVVTVASIFGLVGCAQLSDYAASKHALVGLHDSLQWELKYRYNNPPIRTTLLLPGRISTPLFSSLAPTSPLLSFLVPTVSPHEIAKRIVAALETEESRWIGVPAFVSLWPWLGVLPEFVRAGAIWFSGSNVAMESFGEKGKDVGGEVDAATKKSQ